MSVACHDKGRSGQQQVCIHHTASPGSRSSSSSLSALGYHAQAKKRVSDQAAPKAHGRRKCEESYGALVFTRTGGRWSQPQCVVCCDVLRHYSMKPSFLRRHLKTKHGDLPKKTEYFFKLKLRELQKCKKIVQSSACPDTENALCASCLVVHALHNYPCCTPLTTLTLTIPQRFTRLYKSLFHGLQLNVANTSSGIRTP